MRKLIKLLVLVAIAVAIVKLIQQQLQPSPPSAAPTPAQPPPPTPRPESASSPQAAVSQKSDDLTKVNGIGKVYAERLAAVGITTYAELAVADAKDLKEKLELAGTADVDSWISQAKRLTS